MKTKNKKPTQRMRGRTRPEIMSPIRNWASLEACKNYADAVYFGLSDLTMRLNADFLTLKDLGRFVKKCHSYGLKAYLTVNSVIYNNDIKKAERIIKKAKQVGVDAVIVWDPAAIEIARRVKIKFIISTQANVSNWQSALFYKKLGTLRVVLAREMTLKQIAELKKKVGGLQIETFVHGAMCLSISGRCILSAAMYGKSANRGSCGQPCRKEWVMTDDEPTQADSRAGKGTKIINQGKYFMSAKDLCMIEYIPELIKAGINAFKIEGRRRDPKYIEVVSRCYREAVDAYFNNTYTKQKAREWKKELASVYNRGFSTGFYFGIPGKEGISYDKTDNAATTKKVRVGIVTKYYPKLKVASIKLADRGLKLNEKILVEGPKTFLEQEIKSMQIKNKDVEKGKRGEEVAVKAESRIREGDNAFIIK